MSYYWVKENFKQIRAIDEQELILFNLLTTATTITMTQKYPLSHVSEIRMTAQHCTEQRVVMHKLPIYICLSFPDASPDLLYTLTRHRHWPPGRRESERQGIRGGPVNAGAHGARYMGAGGTHSTGWLEARPLQLSTESGEKFPRRDRIRWDTRLTQADRQRECEVPPKRYGIRS